MNTLCRTLRVHGLSWVSALRQPTLPLCQKRANTVTTPPTDTFGTPASATFVSLRPAPTGRPSCLSRTVLPAWVCRRPTITPYPPSVCGVFTARLHRFRHAITACSSRDYGVLATRLQRARRAITACLFRHVPAGTCLPYPQTSADRPHGMLQMHVPIALVLLYINLKTTRTTTNNTANQGEALFVVVAGCRLDKAGDNLKQKGGSGGSDPQPPILGG